MIEIYYISSLAFLFYKSWEMLGSLWKRNIRRSLKRLDLRSKGPFGFLPKIQNFYTQFRYCKYSRSLQFNQSAGLYVQYAIADCKIGAEILQLGYKTDITIEN